MSQGVITFFEQHVSLSESERSLLHELIPTKSLPKNHILLTEGDVSREFYFVLEGGIRLYYLHNDMEKTAFFYFEDSFVSSYESFTRQVPARHCLQTIEDTRVAIISHDVARRLVAFSPKFNLLAMIMMEEELIVYQEIISSFVSLSAEDRYLRLLSNHHQILARVPQYQLATYLGVSAETLSRIRKRIADKSTS